MFSVYSRGHPERIQRLLRAWKLTQATSPVSLRLDEDDPKLPQYPLDHIPDNWTVVVGPKSDQWGAYDEVSLDKSLDWVGIITDSLVPHTLCWDIQMISLALANKEDISGDIVGADDYGQEYAEVRPNGADGFTIIPHIIFELRE